ncbi:hypothetical protein [Vulcanococcus sp.]|jgi:hypothetical protein|uniref:hypothetical protein n=1 Tax=Vulcanococcus sp. TaxID=2856995 RepID=UPI00322731B6
MAFGVFRSIKKRLIESASRLTVPGLRAPRKISKRAINLRDGDDFEVVCGVAGCVVKKKEPLANG